MSQARKSNYLFKVVLLTICLAFCSIKAVAQVTTIKGKIIDAQSKEPLMGVGVYLSGTSTGVVSGLDGQYSIDYDEAMKAPLVFAYLGYEKIQIVNPSAIDLSLVLLKEQENELEAVVINPDPWDRATKEKLFVKNFLGDLSLENSKVLNLKDVRLRFNTDTKQLTAVSRRPIMITNSDLGYLIKYDLVEFEINFKFIKPSTAIEKSFEIEHARHNYVSTTSFMSGTSFYKELDDVKPNMRTRERRRNRAFKSSQLLLYRSIVNKTLKENKFHLYNRGFRVKPEDHIRVRQEGDVYKVTFRNLKYSIKDRDGHQTDITLKSNFIYFDPFGNILSARDLLMSGYISQLGVGGMMPLDYTTDK